MKKKKKTNVVIKIHVANKTLTKAMIENKIIIAALCACAMLGCSTNSEKQMIENKTGKNAKAITLACKLTSSEIEKRKATTVASLRKKIIDKKELENGYAFKFNGS